MAGEHRKTVDTLAHPLTELSERIRSADFVAAVRQIECAYPDKPRIGDQVRVRDDIVRFSQNVTLGFRGNTLQSLKPNKGSHEYRLHVNFFGLLGSHGPMPLHYTEYADQRARHHSDPTFKEFLDLFNHRMLSLFYRASVQFDPSVSFDRPENNSYAEILGALCGVLSEKSTSRDSISDNAKRYYPGWMTSTAKSPDGIAAIVEDYFALPVSIKEWVGGWLPLPEVSRSRLGSGAASMQLGRSLNIGKRVWSIRHKFNVVLGPLDRETFSSFKPGGERALSLHDLVRNYVGDEWDWDLQLILKKEDIRHMRLDRSHALGFDSWMKSGKRSHYSSQSVLLNRKLISRLAH
ncbi:MAG: type VI secretion system protein ImpH [Granulosicoccus sp.]|jgi:type VI secretion system protein ImpH